MAQPLPNDEFTDFRKLAWSVHNRNERFLEVLKNSDDSQSKILATIIESVGDGLIVFDDQLITVLVNLAAIRIAGWHMERLTREEMYEHYQFFVDEGHTPLPHEDEPAVEAVRTKKISEKTIYVSSPHLPPEGLWVRGKAAPVLGDDGQLLGVVTIFNDITAKVRLQRQRDCLAALITHDIKNHLVAQDMFFEMLVKEGLAKWDGDASELFHQLRVANEAFLGIATSLMEMFRSHFFEDKYFAKDVDVGEIVRRAVALDDVEASKRQIKLKVDCAQSCPKIRALPGVVLHVIHNLIQNAVKTSRSGGVVEISVYPGVNTVKVQVQDHGQGMSLDQVSNLLSPHKASEHMSMKGLGSEFGLYLSAMLVEGQGGKITCDSEVGKGTTMTVIMPAYAA